MLPSSGDQGQSRHKGIEEEVRTLEASDELMWDPSYDGLGGTRQEGSPGRGNSQACLLEVDVGADQHVVEQEDSALLGLDQLPAVTVHGLRQRLTQEQLTLA